MKKYTKLLVLLVVGFMLAFSTTSCNKVPAGNVGVKFYALGGAKGVDTEILKPGRYWIGMNEELYLFPTYIQNYVWTESPAEGSPNDESISFDVEGMKFGADVGIEYTVDPLMVPKLFQQYKKGIDEITDIHLRNMVRNAFVKYSATMKVDEVYGTGKAGLLANVLKDVQDKAGPNGIKVANIFLIGSLKFPPSVTTAISKKIEAAQKTFQRQEEVKQERANADKATAVAKGKADSKIIKAEGDAKSINLIATAQAEANRVVNKSLTDRILKYRQLQKWDGKLPQVTSGGQNLISFGK